MKKSLTVIALLTAILITLSANTTNVVETAPGCEAPSLDLSLLSNHDTDTAAVAVNTSAAKGYKLINFWAVTDATSRMAAGTYDTAIDALGEDAQISYFSISLDENAPLVSEVVRRDKLNPEHQYRLDPEQVDQLYKHYHFESGLRTLLIDPQGVIIAVNPAPEQLATLTTQAV